MICKTCTERVEAFDQYYEEIHKKHQKFQEAQASDQAMAQQKDEIRYIILLKDNKTEIQEDTSDRITLIDIPETAEGDNQQFEVIPSIDAIISRAVEEKVQDEASTQSEEEFEIENHSAPDSSLAPMNLKGFPKELIRDGRLLIKGKELSKLIAKFYRLECSLCSIKKKFRKFSAMMNHYKAQHSIKGRVAV